MQRVQCAPCPSDALALSRAQWLLDLSLCFLMSFFYHELGAFDYSFPFFLFLSPFQFGERPLFITRRCSFVVNGMVNNPLYLVNFVNWMVERIHHRT
jgi:hypothetical protein